MKIVFSMLVVFVLLGTLTTAAKAFNPPIKVVIIQDWQNYTEIEVTADMVDTDHWAKLKDANGNPIWVWTSAFGTQPSNTPPFAGSPGSCHCNGSCSDGQGGTFYCEQWRICGSSSEVCKVTFDGRTCCFSPCP